MSCGARTPGRGDAVHRRRRRDGADRRPRDRGELRRTDLRLPLGASSDTYVEALRSQDLASWSAAHGHAFAFLGGVTQALVPDHLKRGGIAASLYEPVPNRPHAEMARHY
jgi:transposase